MSRFHVQPPRYPIRHRCTRAITDNGFECNWNDPRKKTCASKPSATLRSFTGRNAFQRWLRHRRTRCAVFAHAAVRDRSWVHEHGWHFTSAGARYYAAVRTRTSPCSPLTRNSAADERFCQHLANIVSAALIFAGLGIRGLYWMDARHRGMTPIPPTASDLHFA